MTRVNVYLPDDLADRVRRAGINVSAVTRAALQDALSARDLDAWLDRLPVGPGASHEAAMHALDEAREELGA